MEEKKDEKEVKPDKPAEKLPEVKVPEVPSIQAKPESKSDWFDDWADRGLITGEKGKLL